MIQIFLKNDNFVPHINKRKKLSVMKNTLKTVLFSMLIALVPMLYYGCDSSGDDESCEQQDMSEILTCDGEKNVEVCCVAGSDCVYKFDGQEYPDTEQGLNNLADALGCTYKSIEAQDAEKNLIIEELVKLREKARLGSY